MPRLQIEVEVLNEYCDLTCPFFEIEELKLVGDTEIIARDFKCAKINFCQRFKNYLAKKETRDE